MRIVHKAMAGAAATLMLLGAAAPASAETLTRAGASRAAIVPVGAPADAKVVKAKVTVKKGKKTVARNKNLYRAKKGTYKVTSTVSYFPITSVAVPASDVWADCRVTGREVVSDRTDWNYPGDSMAWLSGQATIRYTGTCTDDARVWDSAEDWWVQPTFTWTTSWTEDEYIFADYTGGPDRSQVVLSDAQYKIGDLALVDGADMSSLPTAQVHGPRVTTKNTRTVLVR